MELAKEIQRENQIVDFLKYADTQEKIEAALASLDCDQLRILMSQLQCSLVNLTETICRAKGFKYVG